MPLLNIKSEKIGLRQLFRGFAGLGAFVLMQACLTTKSYVRPELETEALYRTDNLPADSITAAEISWREFFRDPILQGYIATSLENNMDIRVALEAISQAESSLKQGKAAYLPTVSASGSVTRTKNSENSQFGSFFTEPITQFDLSGTLSWEADIWGRIRSTRRASEAAYLQRVAAHQAIKTQLVAALASTYYQLLALDQQREITKRNMQARTDGLQTTRALKDAGLLTEVAVKQTEAQLYQTEVILIEIENNIRLLENMFCILLGEPPHVVARSGELPDPGPEPIATGLPSYLLSNRPDVLQAEYGLRNAFELSNVARASMYPSLNLSAAGGFQSLDFSEWISTSSLFSRLLGSLTQPLLNGRQLRTQYEVSESQRRQALIRYEQALLQAGREVSDALFDFDAATRSIDAREREYRANTLAEEYSVELLNNGMANYLEVLTARRNALTSELSYTEARYRQNAARVELYRALGGGWR